MAGKKAPYVGGSLLTIGDEILLGDILNTNAHHIAVTLRAHGFRLERVITVEDQEDAIAAALHQLLPVSAFLIVTGGLGPTDDDRTKHAVARAFSRPLEVQEEDLRRLQGRLRSAGRTWNQHVHRLAELPQGATQMAPGQPIAGFLLEHHQVPCYFLPGVPHEMEILLDEIVLPDLMRRFPKRPAIGKRILRVQEMMETEINQRLCRFDWQETGVALGYLPQVGENWVTLLAVGQSQAEVDEALDKAEAQVTALLGRKHISGRDDESLEVVVGRLLRQKGWGLAVAESCTGGLLAQRITSVPGASEYFERGYVTYSNRAKVELLGVPAELLEAHGAVSHAVCRAMAEGAREKTGVEAALAVTGIAGPTGGSPKKPVGTVFVGCSAGDQTLVKRCLFHGSRERIQQQSAHAALTLLWRRLTS
ncbi:competence/damage-inducible protein cinA [Desulfacinum hydrothermale DSM 13146]|uniref:CinA-like protein n=1 Tax=Desulfacinum hydrothermale DSM 13146 TaxID=1121390 RepID=A0A1W1XCH7_9BACT|nr:CinA family nicotinamide mononucleotide deamidase-related protein [Desulfacinum hydrothermale]SMC21550.1 competence/damage-inducible protein cinA [Desulfacinum hydrothermale DSM 13146]